MLLKPFLTPPPPSNNLLARLLEAKQMVYFFRKLLYNLVCLSGAVATIGKLLIQFMQAFLPQQRDREREKNRDKGGRNRKIDRYKQTDSQTDRLCVYSSYI